MDRGREWGGGDPKRRLVGSGTLGVGSECPGSQGSRGQDRGWETSYFGRGESSFLGETLVCLGSSFESVTDRHTGTRSHM